MSQYEDDIMEVSSTDNSININIGENKDTIISLVGKYVHRGADSGSGGGVGGLNIITSEMFVPSSDNSVYSSLRTDVSFLNKETTSVQRVQGEVQFGEKLILNDQGEIPLMTTDFIDAGGQIRGAQLTKDGIFTAAGIKAMSFEVFELIYNTIKAQGGTFAFSNSANIENVWYKLGDGSKYNVTKNTYESNIGNHPLDIDYFTLSNVKSVELAVKKDEANKAIPFRNGDILYGYVNKIGESGQPAEGGQCIMRVISDNRVLGEGGNMVFEAQLFPIGSPSENPYEEVSSNILPVPGIALAQRGNVNPNDNGMGGNNHDRLTSFFIDTSSANMYMLNNVTSPNLDVGSYGLVLGKLPDSLWSKINAEFAYVQPNDPVIYAKYGIFENFLQFDHLGNIIPKERSRGKWDADIAAGIKKDEKGNLIEQYKVTNQYYDTVTYDGELYKCTISDNTEKPSTGYGWMKLVSKGEPGKSINPNLLQNSNFDVYDSMGELLNVSPAYGNSKLLGSVINRGYDGTYNSYRYGTVGNHIIRLDFGFNIKRDVTYTISFQSKWVAGDYDDIGFLLYVPTNVVSLSNINGVLYGDNTNRYTLWTVNTKEWNSYSFSFKYTPEEGGDDELSGVYIELYRWDSADGEIAQIKVEEGDTATPYQKHQEDLKGKDGKNGRDGIAARANLLIDTTFDAFNSKNSVWSKTNLFSYNIGKAADGYGAFGINTLGISTSSGSNSYPSKAVTQSVLLSSGYWYILSFYYKGNPYVWVPISTSSNFKVYLNGSEINFDYNEYLELPSSDAWTFVEITFYYDHSSSNNLISIGLIYTQYNTLSIVMPKLEALEINADPKSAKATPWTKSVEDLKGATGDPTNENLLSNTDFTLKNDAGKFLIWQGTGIDNNNIVVNPKAINGIYNQVVIPNNAEVWQSIELMHDSNNVFTLSFDYTSTGNGSYIIIQNDDVLYTEFVYNEGTLIIDKNTYKTAKFELPNTAESRRVVIKINMIMGKGTSPYLENFTFSFGYSNSDSADFKISKIKLELGEKDTPYLRAMSDLAGPAGEAGPLIYPQGEWSAEATYEIKDNSVPFVYHKGTYYVLQITYSKGEDPSLPGKNSWKPFTNMKYIFTEALMAQWAKLAQAVFWGDYMFSYFGMREETLIGYEQFKDTMFDSNNRLSGNFIPNLFLDLKQGEIKVNKFSETALEIGDLNANVFCMEMNPFNSFNYVLKEKKVGCIPIITLPTGEDLSRGGGDYTKKYNYSPSGIHASIYIAAHTELDAWKKIKEGAENAKELSNVSYYYTAYPELLKYCTLIHSKTAIFDQRCYYLLDSEVEKIGTDDYSITNPNFSSSTEDINRIKFDTKSGQLFSVHGELTTCILLEPGGFLKLRSMITTHASGSKSIIWIVENASDFQKVHIPIEFYGYYLRDRLNSSQVVKSTEYKSITGWYDRRSMVLQQGIARQSLSVFASKTIAAHDDYFKDGMLNGSIGENMTSTGPKIVIRASNTQSPGYDWTKSIASVTIE